MFHINKKGGKAFNQINSREALGNEKEKRKAVAGDTIG